jgi:hypothetical protein
MTVRRCLDNLCVSLSRSVKLEDSLRDDDVILRRQELKQVGLIRTAIGT